MLVCMDWPRIQASPDQPRHVYLIWMTLLVTGLLRELSPILWLPLVLLEAFTTLHQWVR